MYEDGGRPELADAEKAEIFLIQQFLPEQLSRDDIEKAITEAIAQINAASIKDMGKSNGAFERTACWTDGFLCG